MTPSTEASGRKLAHQVLSKTLHVRRGENVMIESWSEALPWAVPFVTEARRIGARPMMLYEDENAFWEALRGGGSRATGQVGEHEWSALEKTDAYVFLFGPAEWTRYDALSDRQTEGVAAYNAEWYRRASKAKLRGARLYLGRTSEAAAKRWKVDLARWRESLLRASLASPERMHALGTKVGARLRRGKSVSVTHPNGTDLSFRLGQFPVQLDDALVDARDLEDGNNMATIPGGVVGVSIDHRSGRGTAVGNHTVYPNTGPASGIQWSFKGGRLVAHEYARGGKAFDAALAEAPPEGRDRLSYFSIGLNPDLTYCPQMEDQELGAVMLRIGGNTFAGGKNASPFGSWMVLDGATVTVDGKPLVRSGKIV